MLIAIDSTNGHKWHGGDDKVDNFNLFPTN